MPSPAHSHTFHVHPERLAIARLTPDAAIPTWIRGSFQTVSRTPAELSIVCAQACVPATVTQERDKIALGIEGVVPMTTIGLLARLCSSLAESRVPVFVISTYDTDWLLVSADRFDDARLALERIGNRIVGALPPGA